MKVILKEEVKNLGKEWDVVTVADGYARNFLLPRKMAMLATQAGVQDLERRRQKSSLRRAQEEETARALAARLEQIPVAITAKAGPEGRLYGSVTAGDLADYFQAHGVEVDRRRIEIAAPIRTVGEHHATVALHSDVTVHVRVLVNAEGAPLGAAATAGGEAVAGGEAPAESQAPAPSALEEEEGSSLEEATA